MRRSEITAKLDEIIAFSEIEKFIDTPVKRYSSGMYVKLAFAVAAHLAPDILICDEVLAVGDLAFQQKCLSKMRDVASEGRAVLYVSHNMRTVSELCNRGIYLERGRLTYDGTTEHAIELYAGSGIRDLDRDLDSMPRPVRRGETMRMLRMTMHNTGNLEYSMDGAMEFTLTSVARVADPRLRVRIMLYSSMATPIAMTQTEAFPVEAGETFSLRIRMPLDGIAPGEYAMKMSLISLTPDRALLPVRYDRGTSATSPSPTIRSETTASVWQERLWGNFRLKPLVIERTEG